MLEAARKDPAWENGDEVIIMATSAHTSQQWAIEANKRNQTVPTLPARYQQHVWLFSEDATKRFPPSWPKDLAVRLKPGTPDTINCKVYPLACNEIQAAAEFTSKNEELGRIKKANSPWGSPFFFIKKKDSSLRPVQDYRAMNIWTERDVYPMPHIEQILEQLHGKVLFTTLDIRDGYNNIHVRPKDQWKLAFKLPEGTYAPQVMFFGMTNAPAVFQRTMDRIFVVLKNKYPGCIFVYMDDILIATPDNEELHAEIVNAVLDMLAAEDFFLKLSKCLFHQRTMDYLGIRIEGGIIRIDPTKRNSLATWKEVLDDVHDVRSTLGLFGYNRPFIKGYAHIVRPVQQLTKKDVPFVTERNE